MKLSIVLAISTLFIKTSTAHSFLAEPKTAVRTGFGETCQNGYAENPCCATKDKARPSQTVYNRGQEFEYKWPRNNHPGGFIRMALVPLSDSDSQTAFNQNVLQFNCHESGCKSGYADDLEGGDGSNYGDHENLCSNKLTIPKHLANGQYTIQWVWMGGFSYYGDNNRGQTTYQNCMDFTVTGNDAPVSKPDAVCPVFKGGDPHNDKKKDKCLTFVSGEKTEPSMNGCFPDGCDGKKVSVAPQSTLECSSYAESSADENTAGSGEGAAEKYLPTDKPTTNDASKYKPSSNYSSQTKPTSNYSSKDKPTTNYSSKKPKPKCIGKKSY